MWRLAKSHGWEGGGLCGLCQRLLGKKKPWALELSYHRQVESRAPVQVLSCRGASLWFPVSVSLGGYRGGNGKRPFELIAPRVMADLAEFG